MNCELVATTNDPTVLVVDDEPINLKIISAALRTRGYGVQVADGGVQAMRVIEQAAPDLILLDVMMPEMDGFELCRWLRSQQDSQDIPVLFVTANIDQESQLQGFAVGGQDYITKPIRVAELLARVDAQMDLVVARKQMRSDLERRNALLQILCQDLKMPLGLIEREAQNCTEDEILMNPLKITDVSLSITHASQHALALIDLVQANGADNNVSLSLYPVALGEALDDALKLHELNWKTKQIEIINQVDPNVFVNAEYVSLVNCVFGALLGNAIKYSDCGSRVEIGYEILEGDKGDDEEDAKGDASVSKIRLDFVDSGIGLPDGITAEQLMDIGSQGRRSGTSGETGSGHGLFLAQRFVCSFGGVLMVYDRGDGNQGCRASVTLNLITPKLDS